MAKKVDMWEAHDGTKFATRAEAEEHEQTLVFQKRMSRLFEDSDFRHGEKTVILEFISTNANALRDALNNVPDPEAIDFDDSFGGANVKQRSRKAR